MAFIRTVAAAPALLLAASTAVSATGVLLPLYTYPGDNAAAWNPVLEAITVTPDVPWLAVINPSNGPGPTGLPGNDDMNYIHGVTQLNAQPNTLTLGYVRTDHGASPLAAVQRNITTWASWANYTANDIDIGVDGIFFDETSPDPADVKYLESAVSFARTAFGTKQVVAVCNFGTAAPPDYYRICDVVVSFESALNQPNVPAYQGKQTIVATTPGWDNLVAQSAVLVHDFAGKADDGRVADAELLRSYVQEAKDAALGWLYFGSGGYDSLTTGPATVLALAAAF
ncbi:Spherulation-specific family 4 [Astrocystis sublimbata]|nr:Spherulation-specific family 4 [Astrocystis sublimbata]